MNWARITAFAQCWPAGTAPGEDSARRRLAGRAETLAETGLLQITAARSFLKRKGTRPACSHFMTVDKPAGLAQTAAFRNSGGTSLSICEGVSLFAVTWVF